MEARPPARFTAGTAAREARFGPPPDDIGLNDTNHQQVKNELAKIKAELDAKMKLLDAHLKTVAEQEKMQHAQVQHEMAVAGAALGMVAAEASHEDSAQQKKDRGDV